MSAILLNLKFGLAELHECQRHLKRRRTHKKRRDLYERFIKKWTLAPKNF